MYKTVMHCDDNNITEEHMENFKMPSAAFTSLLLPFNL